MRDAQIETGELPLGVRLLLHAAVLSLKVKALEREIAELNARRAQETP